MKSKEKEFIKLLKWIQEYKGIWQIICNPSAESCSLEAFNMAYDKLIEDSMYYLIPVLITTHYHQQSVELAMFATSIESMIRDVKSNGFKDLLKDIREYMD